MAKKDIELVNVRQLQEIIRESVDLPDPQRKLIESRWLRYVEWWDSRAKKAKRRYHGLRAVVVVGSALTPALVALRELGALADFALALSLASIAISLVVAICGSLEGLFSYGDIWRHKRDAAEVIKSEGFLFFQCAGPYKGKTHAEAFPLFAENVERLVRQEIKEYLVAVADDASGPGRGQGQGSDAGGADGGSPSGLAGTRDSVRASSV